MAINCKAILTRPVSQCCAIVDSVAISSTANICVLQFASHQCSTFCQICIDQYCTLVPFCSHMVPHLLQRDHIVATWWPGSPSIAKRWEELWLSWRPPAGTPAANFLCAIFNFFCTLSTIFFNYQQFSKSEGLASFTHNCSLCWSKPCFFSLLLLFCSFHWKAPSGRPSLTFSF